MTRQVQLEVAALNGFCRGGAAYYEFHALAHTL